MGSLSIFHWLVLIIFLAIYFVPAMNARGRGHQNTSAIFVLNLFLGWTLIGWVAALVWSFTAVQRMPNSDRQLSAIDRGFGEQNSTWVKGDNPFRDGTPQSVQWEQEHAKL